MIANKKRSECLDLLRILGFLMVFSAHGLWGFIGADGGTGVALFFIISGFVVGIKSDSFSKAGFKESFTFLGKRLKRVYVPYILSVIISFSRR